MLDEAEVWRRYFALEEQKIYYVVAWNKLYRAELFRELRYAEGKRYEDQFLMPRLLAQCGRIACLAYPGYRYVQRGGSIMAQGSSRNYLDRSEFLLEWCDYFAGKGDLLRAEGLLNDAIQNLSEKERFDLSTPAAARALPGGLPRLCGCLYAAGPAYRAEHHAAARRLLRLGLPVYQKFLQSKNGRLKSSLRRAEPTKRSTFMEQMQKQYHVHYSPAKGWARVDFGELWRYKDLIWLFVKRDFYRYVQTDGPGARLGPDQPAAVGRHVYGHVRRDRGYVHRRCAAGAVLPGRYGAVGLLLGLHQQNFRNVYHQFGDFQQGLFSASGHAGFHHAVGVHQFPCCSS